MTSVGVALRFRRPARPAQPRGSANWYRILALPMLVASLGSLPRMVNFGPLTAMGLLTIVQAGLTGIGLVGYGRYPRWLLGRVALYGGFLIWAVLTVIWEPPHTGGIQNLLVYVLFGLILLYSGTLAARDPERVERVIDRGMFWISAVILSIVALELALKGLPGDPEEGWWIGPRPVAIIGLIVISRYLSRWYHGELRARSWVALWVVTIIVTLSRAATSASLLLVGLVVLAQMRFRRRRAAVSVPVMVAGVALLAVLVLTWSPLYDRMFGGDPVDIGGTAINVAGRLTMWSAVIESARNHTWLGGGLGSAQDVVYVAFADRNTQMSQPHNDYLRLWHDLGLIGLGFYLLAVLRWMWVLWREWYRAERSREAVASLEMSGLLALLALSTLALTDNPLIYQSNMGIAAILIGAGLGARSLRHARGSAPLDEEPDEEEPAVLPPWVRARGRGRSA